MLSAVEGVRVNDTKPPILRSPWLSISDMLIANRCWLCEAPFQRGYKKKVFLVSQLVSSMTRRIEEISSATDKAESVTEIESNNFRACFAAFSTELGCSETDLSAELLKHDVAPWLSGLVCCRTTNCATEYALLVPSESSMKAALKKIEEQSAENQICPPDCGCDNPWPFLQA
jgi:hypothetical protein